MKRSIRAAGMTAGLLCFVGFAGTAGGAPGDVAIGVPVAWIRFVDGPESYAGRPYHWLGRGPLRVRFDVAPAAGQVVELLWGAKQDERAARVQINQASQVVRRGGHDGFEWVRLPVPEAVRGTQLDLGFFPTGERAAFLAEIRLTQPGGAAAAANLEDAAHRARLIEAPQGPGAAGVEAFPEMRAIWDREPPADWDAGMPAELAAAWRLAERNARLANEAFYRCRRFVDGWLAQADPVTGLIPRNLTSSRDFWNGRDAAADNYPFMVLTASMTDRALLEGRMLDMLKTEIRLTSRVGNLTDDYSFSKQGFRRETVDLEAIIFDSAEYIKDGLIPITEWLGRSPWSERMIGLMDDIWKEAAVETPHGRLPTLNLEVNGDLLQAGSRLFWFTGDRRYLDWAIRLGDYYLLGDQHPTRNLSRLRLSDHGCEVINGLAELYAAVSHAAPEKQRAYAQPIHEMLERILEAGRNADGLLYVSFDPQTGEHAAGLCDTWGYNFDGFYTVYLLDGTRAYRDAVRLALGNLHGKYVGAAWADKSADGFADSIEGALNLFNREPVPTADQWIDHQTRLMWGMQKPDGIIEGWHGDGNFARTTLMYALWKTAGITLQPWRADVRVGAVRAGRKVLVSLTSDEPWSGRLVFDRARHRSVMGLPLDYPRINQFPEWFVAEPEGRYRLEVRGHPGAAIRAGAELIEGVAVEVTGGGDWRAVITELGRD